MVKNRAAGKGREGVHLGWEQVAVVYKMARDILTDRMSFERVS